MQQTNLINATANLPQINKNKEKHTACGIKTERDPKGAAEWMRGGS